MIYRPFAFSNDRSPAVIPQRATRDLLSLSLDDPAITAMTDFTQECPVTVSPERHIDDALKDMIRAGVRSLLVLEEDCVLGLITSFDIQGERPILFLQSPECAHYPCLHRDVTVVDIMTGLDVLPRLEWERVLGGCVGDLVETFHSSGNTHLLVTEKGPSQEAVVRGLFSHSRLIRQIAMPNAGTALDRVAHHDHRSSRNVLEPEKLQQGLR
ncbi:MAG TPA: CBS domain-containing protein [Candidatus Binataceae bacterium]|nr:CBS domain-containing protein [Candidatus Binataceae bacterium]